MSMAPYFSCVVDDNCASHLDEEFLENVAQHGVLLYEQPGYTLPAVLVGLTPLSTWKERLADRLVACEHLTRRAS
jgi:hypothetical protein